jgi:hypothetical protein
MKTGSETKFCTHGWAGSGPCPTCASEVSFIHFQPHADKAPRTFNEIAAEIGGTVTVKNAAYGDSFAKTGDFLRLLYPEGIAPEQYGDALCMVRTFDKQMRIATAKDALGESPYRDIAGYAVLGIAKDAPK